MPATCRSCGKLTSDQQPNCIYCGTLLVPPVPCPGCKRDVPAHFAKCLYCGTPTSGAKPVPAAAAPAPAPPPKIAAPAAPALPPRPPPLQAPPSRARSIFRISLFSLLGLSVAGTLWHFRSVRAMWPCLASITWFVLASVSFTARQRRISKVGFVGRDATIGTSPTGVRFRSSAIQLAASVVLWLVVFLLGFKGAYGISQYAFWAGLFFFASALFTNYRFKETRARVMDPDLEQHISEFGLPLAVARHYYIWGFMPPFVHAAFRLML